MNYQTVIFDLDGTLLNTRGVIKEVMLATLKELHFIGFVEYATKKYNRQLWEAKVKPYRGIEALLLQLQKNGIKLAVLSNGPDELVQEMIPMFFPDVFRLILGRSEAYPKKPDSRGLQFILSELDADLSQTVLIGDAVVDYQAAEQVGVQTIGAGWGPSATVKKLKRLKRCPIAAAPSDITDLLRRM